MYHHKHFVFVPMYMLTTDAPYADEIDFRVFQVFGAQHRCRLSHPLRKPGNPHLRTRSLMDADIELQPKAGGMELIEQYRQDKRWQEITDPARVAAIANEINWPVIS